MRYISKIKKKKFNERISFDRLLQLWFNYHFFFFQSLIFRGLKLRAFSLFIAIKFGLKSYNYLETTVNAINSKEDDFLYDVLNYDFVNKIFSYDNFLSKMNLFSVGDFFENLSKKRCSFTFV